MIIVTRHSTTRNIFRMEAVHNVMIRECFFATCSIHLYYLLSDKCHSQINNTIRACYIQLRSMSLIREYLPLQAVIKLCHAFVTSRPDNMNAILYKLQDYQIKRMQKIQNNIARLILTLNRSDHITHILQELHWLPESQRIVLRYYF